MPNGDSSEVVQPNQPPSPSPRTLQLLTRGIAEAEQVSDSRSTVVTHSASRTISGHFQKKGQRKSSARGSR